VQTPVPTLEAELLIDLSCALVLLAGLFFSGGKQRRRITNTGAGR
jgi:hypothetical protein